MELRSRSRSKTPLLEGFKVEEMTRANHVEKSISKTTSTKRTTVIRTGGEDTVTSMDADEVTSFTTSKPATRRMTRSQNAKIFAYKTSDYSSEEGENEVTSTRTISQNEKNQIIEDARAAANGNGEISALELYRKSGRYWDVYPKTDWTYSHYSKDRVELAPGVVAMPNMSRKTIHSVCSDSQDSDSYTNFVNRETNTDSYFTKYTATELNENKARRRLFNNNYNSYEKQDLSYWSRTKKRILNGFLTVFTMVSSVCYYLFYMQTRVMSKLHHFAGRVMVWDTYLLRKVTNGANKPARLAALCLIPLILFGGLHVMLASGISLAPSCHPNCGYVASKYLKSYTNNVYSFFNFSKT